MVKHTQTIRRQFADELFECAWSFCGVGAYRVKETGNLFDMIWSKWLKIAWFRYSIITSLNEATFNMLADFKPNI